MTCKCGAPATRSYLVRVGEVPTDPKVMNTQGDLSKLQVVYVCARCLPR